MRRLFLVLLMLLAPTAISADYDDGLQAYQRADYETAYSEWLAVSLSPDGSVHPNVMAETCYALGMLFWVGQGVEQNTTASARWLLRAAELGHAGAQTKLGYLFGSGQGVVQSDFEALKWTQMAANQGDVDAQYNLGVFYRDGQGVQVNSELALKWFREAASNGDQVSADIVSNYKKYGWPHDSVDSSVDSTIDSSVDPSFESLAERRVDDPEVIESSAEAPSDLPAPEALVIRDEVAEQEFEAPVEDIAESAPVQDVQAKEFADLVEPVESPAQFNEDWIRERNPQHFTIQVMALLALDNLANFIEQNSAWSPFAIYMQTWKGKPLYVLLQGDYPDIEKARAAAAEFPLGLQQREELWIRKFVMVQSLLKDD